MTRGDAVVGAKFSGQAALTARLMMYVLIAIVLMAMDHRGQYVPRMRAWADYLVEPIYHVVEWPVRALRGTWSFFQSSQSMLRRNKDLADQLLAQQSQLQRFEALEQENRRLRELLDGSGKLDIDYQFAEMIDVDLDPFSHRVVIDRGQDRGVEVGQAVIDGAGVIGQVEEVNLHFSRVRLISDPNHALPVQIMRTGLRTVAFGLGNTGQLSLPSLPREADVREGDLLVTSGLGSRFPGGYPVAEIEVVDRAEGRMFAEAFARPLAALDRGREVLLLKNPPLQHLRPLADDVADSGASASAPVASPDDDQATEAGSPTEAATDSSGTAGESVQTGSGETESVDTDEDEPGASAGVDEGVDAGAVAEEPQ
ncbi:MAG TPA: rod shape-determining protein MreC [Xanthomonadales bacterium]|nr:rod shape-determining protein MreC [Xanthomonadales bacterium]